MFTAYICLFTVLIQNWKSNHLLGRRTLNYNNPRILTLWGISKRIHGYEVGFSYIFLLISLPCSVILQNLFWGRKCPKTSLDGTMAMAEEKGIFHSKNKYYPGKCVEYDAKLIYPAFFTRKLWKSENILIKIFIPC